MSFADEAFDFDKQDGISLVTGKNFDIPNSRNGAGKSNIFASLLYGLFGQLSNKVKGENIANRYVDEKDVRVAVYLSVDGVKYKAVSGMNKRAQGYFSLATFENGEEKDITKSTVAETRKFFEDEVLHCDVSLFLRTILLTSEQNYNFFNLKKQDKKDFIEKLFDIGLFGDMYDKIHRDVLRTEKDVMLHQSQLVTYNANEDDYKTRMQQFDEQVAAQKKQLQAEETMRKAELDKVLGEVAEKNVELIAKYDEARKKLFELKFKLNEQLTSKKLAVQQMTSDIASNRRVRIDRKQILDKHAELLGKLCKDCKKVFDKYHNLSTYKKEIDAADEAVEKLTEQQSTLKAECEALQKKLAEVDVKMTKASEKLVELSSASDALKRKQLEAERALSAVKSKLEQLDGKANPYAEMLENVQKKIASETKTLEEVVQECKYLRKAEQIVSQDSLKKFIIKDLICMINSKIKQYLMKMGAKYTCVFDEDLDYTFMTESGSCELQNFSCGEKKRLEIATCLSFRDFIAQRSNISSNILILDEYIDSGIDALAVESILNILKGFTTSSKQNIFIISHRSEVSNDLFDRVIELQKKNGISTIHYL